MHSEFLEDWKLNHSQMNEAICLSSSMNCVGLKSQIFKVTDSFY